MTGRIRAAAAVLVIGGIAVAAAGCSPQSSESADGKTTIEVGDRPSADRPEDRKYFDERVSAFEEANPDIDVKAVETAYDPTTFQALAAGGSLPDVLSVPLTEPQGLIKRGQAADLTDTLKSEGLLDSLNPAILKLASDADGKAYGVPTNAYSFGLVYNRALFTAAVRSASVAFGLTIWTLPPERVPFDPPSCGIPPMPKSSAGSLRFCTTP